MPYTGKEQTPSPVVKVGKKTLKNGVDYTVSYASNKNVGTAKVKITGKGSFTGSQKASFRITKAENTLKLKVSSITVRRSSLTRSKTFGIGATKSKGNVVFTLSAAAGKAKIKVSPTGKVTIPKKCRKGSFEITVKAKGNGSYKPVTKTVMIHVK